MNERPAATSSADPRWLDEREQAAWRAYLTLHRRLMHALAHDMRADGLSDADFSVLVGTSEAPGGRLRAHELGASLQWEKSRLSKQITRMEQRGLVQRQRCPEDARGSFVAITAAGRAAIEQAAPRHVDAVRRLFVDVLDAEELDQLAAICTKVITRLDQEPVPPDC